MTMGGIDALVLHDGGVMSVKTYALSCSLSVLPTKPENAATVSEETPDVDVTRTELVKLVPGAIVPSKAKQKMYEPVVPAPGRVRESKQVSNPSEFVNSESVAEVVGALTVNPV